MVLPLFQASAASLSASVLSEIVLILAIVIVFFLIIKSGKFILGVLANSILGLIAIFVLDSIFALGIPINLLTIIATGLFGLPAVAIMVLLRLVGISF